MTTLRAIPLVKTVASADNKPLHPSRGSTADLNQCFPAASDTVCDTASTESFKRYETSDWFTLSSNLDIFEMYIVHADWTPQPTRRTVTCLAWATRAPGWLAAELGR